MLRFSFSRLAAPLVALALTAGAAQAQQTIADLMKAPPPAGGADPVVARIDGTELKRSDVIAALQGLPPQVQQMPLITVYPLLLERMIDGKLIAAAGKRDKMHEDAEVKRKVADAEERAIQEAYINKALNDRLTDEVLKKRYEGFVAENPPQEEVRARHILVADENAAKAVLAELRRGADFAAVARAKSTDGSAREGGDLGFFTRGDMVQEFSDAAFAMKPGEVSKDPVKTQFGFHVIKVESRRTGTVPSFDETKEQLKSEMSQEMVSEVVDDLRSKSKVERFTLEGQPLAPRP